LLLYEYTIFNLRLGVYTSNDRAGRNTFIAPLRHRFDLLRRCLSHLFVAAGAQIALLSFYNDEVNDQEIQLLMRTGRLDVDRLHVAARPRSIQAYLPLRSTMEETYSGINYRTRGTLRSKRRKADREFGCLFVPEITISRNEFLSFNRETMYAVPDETAAWWFDCLPKLCSPFLCGLKDQNGRWLSIVGGRRLGNHTEILWQLNRDGMKEYSIGTVMRTYVMEHEIQHGARRLSFEGGTAHTLRYSFVDEQMIDVLAMRNSLVAAILRQVAKRFVQPGDELAQMLEKAP
jgi:hypothetical protein